VWFGRYPAVAAFSEEGRGWILADHREAAGELREALRVAAEPRQGCAGPVCATPVEEHLRAIRRALEHILDGEIYQVNLARRFRASYSGDPLALWRRMRRESPVPLGFYLDAGETVVLASTMETFLDWEGPGRALRTRPIKGTIGASTDRARDARALLADPKEQAEHAMIVDLMRNDLSRVAKVGTVHVPEVMRVEPYAGLSHLVSTVQCTTREDLSFEELLRHTFPPGSVTGTPKVRAVQVLDALEAHPRGVYTGCVGHVARARGARLAVAIRTATICGGNVDYFAGGGIVAASVPEREVAETSLKAQPFLRAVG
jgi:anthranilate/para-aminobenzoate synthase component I